MTASLRFIHKPKRARETSYVGEIYERVASQNPGEPESHQAVKKILDFLRSVIDANEEKYRKAGTLERLTEPERIVSFRVPRVDDSGRVRANKGYRVQFNGAISFHKGGLRLHPSVNQSVLRFLGFKQTSKNSLTDLPMGGGKDSSNFDPRNKSGREVMAFCQSLMTELYRHTGKDVNIPAGDINMGGREVGYLFGQYKRTTGLYEGVLADRGLIFGSSLARTQTAGYGLVYIPDEMLKYDGKELTGKTVFASGSGNVAIYATKKAQQLGAKAVALSDSSGYIYDEDGVKLDIVKEVRETCRARIKEYVDIVPTAVYAEGRGIWTIPYDIVLPCATQDELSLEDARTLLTSDCSTVAEDANMPSTLEAIELFVEKRTLFMPGKVVNIGGMATFGLGQSQNTLRTFWPLEEVDEKLHTTMINTFARVTDAVERYGVVGNYVAGANIAGPEKVVEAVPSQGTV